MSMDVDRNEKGEEMLEKGEGSKVRVSFGDRMAYGAFCAFELVLRLLPMWVWCRVGEMIGCLGYILLKRYRERIRRNIRIVTGGRVSSAELGRMARRNFQMTMANFLAAAKAATMGDEALGRHVTIVGKENVLEATARGKGCLCLIAHAGNWELLARVRVYFPEVVRFGSSYRELDNPLIEGLWRRRRERNRCEMFGKRDNPFSKITGVLRDNGMVGILCDQNASNLGTLVPYFGKLASTTSLPALVQRRSKAMAVPVIVRTVRTGHWEVTFGEDMRLERFGKDMDAMTSEVNRVLADLGRRSIEDGFWLHNRWKQDPPVVGERPAPVLPEECEKPVFPLRVLVSLPEAWGAGIPVLPFMRSFKHYRPDVEFTVICAEAWEDYWQTRDEVSLVIRVSDRLREDVYEAHERPAIGFDLAVVLSENESVFKAIESIGVPIYVSKSHPLAKKARFKVDDSSGRVPRHEVEDLRDVARRMGFDVTKGFPERREWRELVNEERSEEGKRDEGVCYIAPFSDLGDIVSWSEERWMELCDLLREGTRMGSIEGSMGDAYEVLVMEGDEERGKAFAEKLGLSLTVSRMRDIRSYLQGARVLISPDGSLPMVAAEEGVPCVTLFNTRMPVRHRPLGSYHVNLFTHRACTPCYQTVCPFGVQCLNDISAREVYEAIKSL